MATTARLVLVLVATLHVLPAAAGGKTPCWFLPNHGGDERKVSDCLRTTSSKSGSGLTVTKKVRQALPYDADGLSVVRSGTDFFYVNRKGVARPALAFDNGADYFSEGFARTPRLGRVGYFDKSLKIVIEPQFDFGFPFENSLAVVCNGCVPKANGEHQIMTGGKWGAIDKTGKIVHPLQFTAEELRKRMNP